VEIPTEDLLAMVQEAAGENQLNLSFAQEQRYLSCAFSRQGDTFWADTSHISGNLTGNLLEAWFMTAEEYETLTGEHLELSKDQMAVYAAADNAEALSDTFFIGEDRFDCLSILESYPVSMTQYGLVDCFGFVVSDETVLQQIYTLQKEAYQEYASEITTRLVVDFEDEAAAEAARESFFSDLRTKIRNYVEEQPGADGSYGLASDSKWGTREDLYGMYGTLLFLGLILSVVFLFATALIIYYKQVSEGYEDQNRFRILQKVGMSTAEVKGTIRSQILMIFFLPLLVAAMHVAFAFPILTRLLKILFQSDRVLFMACTAASLGVFVVIYVAIYSVTARVYYKIVRR
jgi:putative ABC transport system permease protein